MTGHIRGGRLIAVAILVYGAALVAISVPLLRRRARMWHAALALALITPANWLDAWLNDPARIRLVPWLPLMLAAFLLAHRLRWRPSLAPAPEPAQIPGAPPMGGRPQ